MKVIITSPWQRLWRLLSSEKAVITRIFLIAGFGGLISLSLPLGIQAIINFIMAGRVSTSWILLVIFVLLGILFSGILIIRQQWLIEFFQQRIFARASLEFSLRLPRIKFEKLEQANPAELMNRFFDILTLQKGLSKLIIDFSTSILQVFFGLLLLALYHPLFILFDLVLVVLVIFLIRVSIRKGLETSIRESSWKYKTAGWLEEVALNTETFRMTPNTNLHVSNTDQLTGHYLKARTEHFRVLVRHYVSLLLFKLLVAAGLLILGSVLVIQREIGIGQFVAAEIIILLIINSVEKIIMNLESVYDVLTALEKIGAVTDLELEEKGTLDEFSADAPIVKIEHLSVAAGPYNAAVVCEDFEVRPGQRIFVKYAHPMFVRTLVMVLTGRTSDYSGHALYRGRSVKSIDQYAMRNEIGEFWGRDELMTASILDNIRAGRSDISSSDIERLLERIGLLRDIRMLPDGENTTILPFSNLVSPAIIKGILLARNVIDKPKLLLIDSEQLPSDPRRFKQMVEFLLHPDHEWAVVFFGEASPDGRLFDAVYQFETGLLELTSDKD